MVLNLENVPESPGKPVKTQISGPHPRVSDSQGLEWSLMICVGNKFTDAAAAGSPGTRPQRSTGMVMYNLGVGPCDLCFTEASRWFWCTLKFENHCNSGEKHEGTDPHTDPDCTIY